MYLARMVKKILHGTRKSFVGKRVIPSDGVLVLQSLSSFREPPLSENLHNRCSRQKRTTKLPPTARTLAVPDGSCTYDQLAHKNAEQRGILKSAVSERLWYLARFETLHENLVAA